MKRLRVVAVDDEPLALQRIEWCLAEFPDVELIAKARSGTEALGLVRSLGPDVMLLDIEMPKPDGLDVVATLDSSLPLEVIFVTAYNEFAVRAFDLSATDYLLKPVERERLGLALERARARLASRENESRVAELQQVVAQLRQVRQAPATSRYETEFWVSERDARIRVPVQKIERIEADGDYVWLVVEDRPRLLRARLRDIEGRIDPAQFVRIHRSQIVRSDLIRALRRRPTGRVHAVLADGSEHPVSRGQLPELRERLRIREKVVS